MSYYYQNQPPVGVPPPQGMLWMYYSSLRDSGLVFWSEIFSSLHTCICMCMIEVKMCCLIIMETKTDKVDQNILWFLSKLKLGEIWQDILRKGTHHQGTLHSHREWDIRMGLHHHITSNGLLPKKIKEPAVLRHGKRSFWLNFFSPYPMLPSMKFMGSYKSSLVSTVIVSEACTNMLILVCSSILHACTVSEWYKWFMDAAFWGCAVFLCSLLALCCCCLLEAAFWGWIFKTLIMKSTFVDCMELKLAVNMAF